MVGKAYRLGNGLSGSYVASKYIVLFLLGVYLFVYIYIGAYFKVVWAEGIYPLEIIFDEREISIAMYSSTLAVLFYIVFTIQIFWIAVQSDIFFNNTTMKIFHVQEVSGREIYFSFFLKRAVDLIIIDVLFILSIFLIYLVRDQVIVLSLISNLHIIIFTSLLLLIIYDLIYSVAGRSSSSGLLTIFVIIIISLVNFAIRPWVLYTEYGEWLNVLPDLLSMAYQYLLISFEASHSPEQIYYPLIFLLTCIVIQYKRNKTLFLRYSR